MNTVTQVRKFLDKKIQEARMAMKSSREGERAAHQGKEDIYKEVVKLIDDQSPRPMSYLGESPKASEVYYDLTKYGMEEKTAGAVALAYEASSAGEVKIDHVTVTWGTGDGPLGNAHKWVGFAITYPDHMTKMDGEKIIVYGDHSQPRSPDVH